METIYRTITELIKKYDNIIIMTHKNPDLDGLASSIALYQIIKSFKKNACIFNTTDKITSQVQKMYETLEQKGIELTFITEKNYQEMMGENTLIIIIDVHKKSIIEYPDLLKEASDVVVLDHHIKGQEYIKNTICSYINSNLSSMAEFMTGYIKYLNKPISSIIATLLLTGIEIDTNGFHNKTSEKTYEAAAYLSKIGADNILKQELLKESKEDFLKRQDLIKNSYMLNENIAMCILDSNNYTPKDLALISEELLQFDNVEASFTIGRLSDKIIGISARSLGKIDVETYMTKLGGGGHLTNAACQLENNSIEEVKIKVEQIINEVIE